jgi:26S proteasome non-ATPase regulatory subunit 9
MDQKASIEAEIEAHISILKANDVTMETPLVDRDGFPRADIDIYAVRGARKRIIELRNDLKENMEEIAKKLQEVYAVPESAPSGTEGKESSEGQAQPFAKVDGVAPGSPASEAVRQVFDS